ncbi:MAG: AsmA-like C-terminal region-containing protein [Bacteroidales bacterium]|jgi:cell division septum initiation protein DivIVA|nr:AsmA-like C-terminal region-containing protein [Bacteroidales bacterium]
MKKPVKILTAVILILVLGIILLPVIYKGKIKGILLDEAEKNLDARLDIESVNISLIRSFPSFTIGLKGLIIVGKGAFETDTLLQVESVTITTGFMDLLNGSPYSIRKILIDRADVRLKVLADGRANWDIAPASEEPVKEEQTGTGGSFRLLLKDLSISNSRFIYDDIQNLTYAGLDDFNFSMNGDLGDERTVLGLKAGIGSALVRYDGVEYLKNTKITWDAGIDADLKNSIYTFADNKLFINDFPLIFNGSVGLPDNGYDLDLSFSTPSGGFKALLSLVPAVYARDFESVKTDGTVSFNGFVKGVYSEDGYPAFKVDLSVGNAWFRYPGLPAEVNKININGTVENPGGDLDNTVIDIRKLSLNLADNPVMARLYLKNPMSDPFIDMEVNIDLELADIGKLYPLSPGEQVTGQIMADVAVKGNLSDFEKLNYSKIEASGKLNSSGIRYSTAYLAQPLQIDRISLTVTPAFLDLADLKIRAGNSDFGLTGKVTGYLGYYLKNETLGGNFILESKRIDANELLTFAGTEEEPSSSDTTAVSAFIVPPGLDLTLKVSAGSVAYLDYDIRNLNGTIRVKDQKLLLDGLTMNGMGGTLRMDGSYATTDPVNPAIDFSLGLKDISIRETFKQIGIVEKFAPVAEKIAGDISGNFKLSGLLDETMMPKMESLLGAGDLATTAIQVNNVNTLNQLSNSLKMDQLKDLKINGTRIIVEFINGAMNVKPFDFKALGIDMNLGGRTSLDQTIGYELKMKIPRTMMGGEANKVVNDLLASAGRAGADINPGDQINVDAIINGTITDPKVKLNLAGMGRDMVENLKEQVKEEVEKKVEEVKDMAKEEAAKILAEADKQAQAILDLASRQSEELLRNAQKLADETKKTANTQADNIVKEAKGKGFIAEKAAEKSAEEVRKQGDKKAQGIMDEARKQSDSVLAKARQEADKIKTEAGTRIGQ